MNLKTRVERLEQAVGNGEPGPNNIVINFVSSDCGSEVVGIKCGDTIWHRQEGETVEELTDRAIAEAPPGLPNCWRMFIQLLRDKPEVCA